MAITITLLGDARVRPVVAVASVVDVDDDLAPHLLALSTVDLKRLTPNHGSRHPLHLVRTRP